MNLDKLLTLFRNKSILVLSDMYPPFVVGGAEISLHLQLRCLNEDTKRRILVVIFSESDRIKISRIDSIDIISIPTQKYWHKNQNLSFLYKYYKSSGKVYKFLVRTISRILNCIQFGMIRQRLNINYLKKNAKGGGGLSKEIFPEVKRDDCLILKKILKKLPTKKILCNNLKSIILASRFEEANREIWQSLETYAYVRDQRFNSPTNNIHFYNLDIKSKECDFEYRGKIKNIKYRKSINIYLQKLEKIRQNSLKKFDNIFVSSNYSLNLVSKFLDKSIQVLGNPIDDQNYIYEKTCDIYQDPKNIILIIGSISEPKGQLEFIKNSVSFLKANPSYIVYFAGKGLRIQKQIEALARKHKINDRIYFKGFIEREKLYELITLSSVVVGTSISPESFGRIPFECIGANRPFVGFSIGAITENVPSKMLAPYRDYKALHKLINDAINKKAQSRKDIELHKIDLLFNNKWTTCGKNIFKKSFET